MNDFARRRMHLSARTLLLLLVASVHLRDATAQVPVTTAGAADSYLDTHEPDRFALVIGNDAYDHLPALASSKADAERMRAELQTLGFQVAYMPGMHSVAELEDTLMTFRRRVKAGDVVAFYYSGHGFSYGGHNYLAPADLPATVPSSRVDRQSVAVESVEDYLGESGPGILIMLVDACRTIASFVILDDENHNVVGKGVAPHLAHEPINSLIGYATRPGTVAAGSAVDGALSIYTKSLAANLSKAGYQFSDVYKYVRRDVINETNGRQEPSLVDESTTFVFLHPTEDELALELKAWHNALEAGTTSAVSDFSQLYAVSRYAAAARRWLTDHANTGTATSTISPLAVAAAWNRAGSVLASVAPPGLAYPRNVDVARRSDAEAFRTHSMVMTTSARVAHVTPTRASATGISLPAGTELRVIGTTGSRGQWLETMSASNASPLFVEITHATTRQFDLGSGLAEVLAPPLGPDAPGLVDAKRIRDVADSLRQAGRTILWASLETGPSQDRREALSKRLQTAHVASVLKSTGLAGNRITSVQGAADVQAAGVRVRIFGQ